MNRIRLFAVLVLAVTAGGGLALATYSYIQNAPVKTVTMPTQKVIVAATDLELGAELRTEDLRVIEWPANATPKGAFGDAGEIVGRGLVMPMIENEPFLPMKLASKEAGSGLPPIIPPGLRAVSVHVNEVIGVAGYALPGTRVDVIATASPTNNQTDTTTKVVLTNVQVLAAGTKFEQNGDQKPQAVNVVTLLVTPEEAERLTLASTEGKIQLALRNPLDQSAPATPGVKSSGLLGPPSRTTAVRTAAINRPVPVVQTTAQAAAPETFPTVEIIRGDKRAQEVVR